MCFVQIYNLYSLEEENQYVTFELVCFFQYLLKLVFTTPIQIVSKLYLVDLIYILFKGTSSLVLRRSEEERI